VRLTRAAEDDFAGILRWTAENFGKAQARTYARTLNGTLTELTQGTDTVGCRLREDIGPGFHTLHVAHKGRKGRHFVVFRVDAATKVIDVLRLLHDSMDLPRHLAPAPSADKAS